jgi:hypothetical protein
MGADRMGSASWISGERTTTSRAGSGCVVASSPPIIAAASPAATSISSGAPPAVSRVSGVKFSMGTAAGIFLPSAQRLSTRRQVHQSYLTTMTTLRGYYSLSKVLTFDNAGFRQHSLSSRRFGLRLRGGSGLLSGRRSFFFRHCCRGFIPCQDRSVTSCRVHTPVVSQARLPHQVLLGKIPHLQA